MRLPSRYKPVSVGRPSSENVNISESGSEKYSDKSNETDVASTAESAGIATAFGTAFGRVVFASAQHRVLRCVYLGEHCGGIVGSRDFDPACDKTSSFVQSVVRQYEEVDEKSAGIPAREDVQMRSTSTPHPVRTPASAI